MPNIRVKQLATAIAFVSMVPLMSMVTVANAQQSTSQPPVTQSNSGAIQKTMTPVGTASASNPVNNVNPKSKALPQATLAANTNSGSLKATVVEIKGTVETAPDGADATDPEVWKPIKEGDQLGKNVMIRTGLRSRCVLMFGEEPNQTVISVRRATLARISEFAKTPNEQRIRMGLGYGAIRGGSSEGTLRSDVVINSTVATLAKRGTEGFEIEVEPTTGRFRISLAQSGLVEALSNLSNQRRSVAPGQYATNGNIAKMWVNQDIFDRCVRFYESEAVSETDLNFIARETTGLSNLGPGGRGLFETSGRNLGSIAQALQDNGSNNSPTTLLLPDGLPSVRPEGNFGFGPTFRVVTPHFERPNVNRMLGRRTRTHVPRSASLRPNRLTRHRSSSRR